MSSSCQRDIFATTMAARVAGGAVELTQGQAVAAVTEPTREAMPLAGAGCRRGHGNDENENQRRDCGEHAMSRYPDKRLANHETPLEWKD